MVNGFSLPVLVCCFYSFFLHCYMLFSCRFFSSICISFYCWFHPHLSHYHRSYSYFMFPFTVYCRLYGQMRSSLFFLLLPFATNTFSTSLLLRQYNCCCHCYRWRCCCIWFVWSCCKYRRERNKYSIHRRALNSLFIFLLLLLLLLPFFAKLISRVHNCNVVLLV